MQKHMQSKGRKSIVEEMGTEEEKRIIADARLKMSGGTSTEGEEKAGAIAQQISTRTIKKVIIGVLVMLLTMPYLEADRPNDSKFTQLVQLHNIRLPSSANLTVQQKLMCGSTEHVFNLTLNNYFKQYPAMFFLRVAGVTYLNDQKVNATLRPSTEVGVSFWPDEILSMEDTPTVAAFSIRAQYTEDARYSIYTTTFVIVILVIGKFSTCFQW